MLPKMSGYTKRLDESKYMSFLTKDYELLQKHNSVWNKSSNSNKKEFDSKPV